MESLPIYPNSSEHVAGIIPVVYGNKNFKLFWDDSFMPVGEDYYMLEKAVYDCALAGCRSIWIVSNKGLHNKIRDRVGDIVNDPLFKAETEYRNFLGSTRGIGVFYVGINPGDRDKRESLPWNVLYAARTACNTLGSISKWIVPKTFYCCFPASMLPVSVIKSSRAAIRSTKNVLFSHNGQTIKDDVPINFTFGIDHLREGRGIIKKLNLENWNIPDKKSRDYKFSEVFLPLKKEEATVIDLPWFYDCTNWESYRQFLGTEDAVNLKKDRFCFSRQKRPPFPLYRGAL